MILAAALAILRGVAGPRWLAWLGLGVAPLLLLGPFYLPQLLVPLWVIAAAVGLGRGDPPRR